MAVAAAVAAAGAGAGAQGRHTLIVAPTAGGKTEAAIFPVLSRMLSKDWQGLSVLYPCPLRALLNDLHPRLDGYAQLVGRRAGLWHGDIGEGAREHIRSDPPDILLTTPESIEAMLISRKTDHDWLFRNLQAVIVDEPGFTVRRSGSCSATRAPGSKSWRWPCELATSRRSARTGGWAAKGAGRRSRRSLSRGTA